MSQSTFDLHRFPRASFVIRMADDALISGQRLCEWCGQAPTLEEELALANTALDLLGRARMLYQYIEQLTGFSEDQLAGLRSVREFQNLLLVELPRGDFAFTMARQYFLDEFEQLYFGTMVQSVDTTLSGIAEKSVKEIAYHRRRSALWMRRLARGTEQSRARLCAAIAAMQDYLPEMFEMDAIEDSLVLERVAVDRSMIKEDWQTRVNALLVDLDIPRVKLSQGQTGGRQGIHTEYLGHLLGELQYMQRAYPGLAW